jgi:lipoprotein-anchoring transpeptidase ErfK/SrfK
MLSLLTYRRAPHHIACVAIAAAAMSLASGAVARANIVVDINKASQSMNVTVDGQHRYTWRVSTGIHGTPSGSYRPQSLSRYHRSQLFNNAPMPYSIFYHRNYAIHGTTVVSRLGSRASHGCVRLHPANAAVLFGLVQQQMGSTRIVIH